MTQRIISLLPGATEQLCALGLADQIVAVSHECDHPLGIARLPRVTSSPLKLSDAQAEIDANVRAAVESGQPLYALDKTQLDALKPTLIVTQALCAVCAVDDQMVRSSVPDSVQVIALSATNFDEILHDIGRLSEATGRRERGQQLALQLKAQMNAVRYLPRPDSPPKVLMLEWADPPYCAGHWVPEQVEAAGGVDVLGKAGARSRRFDWDEALVADPDIVVVAACGYGATDNARFGRTLYDNPKAQQLRALREERLYAVDANSYFSRLGPRVVRGAEILAWLLGRPGAPEAGAALEHIPAPR
jgi:iron complex transport system substrate-binding protein